ncbi:MTAP family purine nucleoside phosphorylase [Clostridiaceae bacterium M8S5]|nr:MTAP family purine nucleoside phosphorylase [Clostridiaceae bacterium M8S5]
MIKKAIIGGTGVYNTGEHSDTLTVYTKFGDVELNIVKNGEESIAFLARHGKNHSVPPHGINYRANMLALKQIGVKYIYTTAAVGSCNHNYAPGDVVMIDDFIDFTKLRQVSIFDESEDSVYHTDMSDPYCKNLRNLFKNIANKYDIDIKGNAVYGCTEGPRFETKAEIKYYNQIGVDVVGMTNVPEVVFAKELGMCYSTVGIITNWCTGFKGDDITLHDMQAALADNKEKITRAFIEIFSSDLSQENCMCVEATFKL